MNAGRPSQRHGRAQASKAPSAAALSASRASFEMVSQDSLPFAEGLGVYPNAELVMTSHTGHWMQWERAELFNDLVTEFLSPDSRLAHG